jgi:photosystem II stability/assembly factor-like uncharacterized protein
MTRKLLLLLGLGLALHPNVSTVSPFGTSAWVSRGPSNLSGLVTALLIDPDDPNRYLAGTPAGMWASSDGGASWTTVASTETINVNCLVRDPVRHDTLYAGSGLAGIYKSVDRGRTWTQISSTARAYSIAISADGSTLLAESAVFMQRSTDGGATWQRVALGGVSSGQVRFHPVDSRRAIAVFPILTEDLDDTGFVTAKSTADGGVTWQPSAGLDANLMGLSLEYFRGDPSIVYAVGTITSVEKGKLWRSDDGGATFHPAGTPLTNGDGMRIVSLFVAPTDSSVVVAGGIFPARTRDGGATFDRPQIYTTLGIPHSDFHGIAADPRYDGVTNKRVLVWGDGGVFRTDDILAANVSWQALSGGFANTQNYAFDIARDGRVIAGSQDTGVAVMTMASTQADHRADGDGLAVALDPTNAAQYFVLNVPDYASVTRVTADGTNYTFADTGTGEKPPTGTFVMDPNDATRMFAGSGKILRLEGFLPSNAPHPQKTTTIRTYPPGSSMAAIAVQPGNSNVVWVGRVDSFFADSQAVSVERTTNALASSPDWKTMNVVPASIGIITRIAIDPADASSVYVLGLHGLLVTRDGGTTWTSGTASAPAAWLKAGLFDVALHPRRSGWWYIAGQNGLYGTADAGTTWQSAPDLPGHVFTRRLQFAPGTETLWASVWSRGLWSLDLADENSRRRAVRH